MALQRQIISMNLGEGIDNSTDIKVGPDNKLNVLENSVYNKLKRIDKRPGSKTLGKTKLIDASNPTVIGASSRANDIFSHGDELLFQNSGALYSYLKDQDKNVFKGYNLAPEITTKTVVANPQDIRNPEVGSLNNLSVITYECYDYINQVQYLKYSVVDEQTNTYLVTDAVVASNASINYNYSCKIITFPVANKMYLVYADNVAFKSKIREVNLTTGALGAASDLRTISLSARIRTAYSNKSGVGELVFINDGYLYAINSSGAIAGITPVVSANQNDDLFYNQAADKLFHAYETSDVIYVDVITHTLTTMTVGATITAIDFTDPSGDPQNLIHLMMCQDPVDQTKVHVFCENVKTSYYNAKALGANILKRAKISTTAVVEAASQVGTSLTALSRPVVDLNRSTIYLCVGFGNQNSNQSLTQQTGFVVDVLKKKDESEYFVVAQFNDSLLSNIGLNEVSSVIKSGNQFFFVNVIRNRIVSSLNSQIKYQGVCQKVTVNLAPLKQTSKAFLSKTTFMSGGFLSAYDGDSITENNFFLYPEGVSATGTKKYTNVGGTSFNVPIGIVETTLDGGFKGITVSCNNGNVIYTNDKVAFNQFGTPYTILYWNTDQVTVPLAATVQVKVNNLMTAAEVAIATRTAVMASVIGSIYSVNIGTDGNTVTINPFISSTNATNVSALATAIDGALADGNYGYSVVYSYQDATGKVIRSAPSIPVIASVASKDGKTGRVSIYVEPLKVSNRILSKVRIELYRTVTNGTLYYKVLTSDYDPYNTGSRIVMIDFLSDTSLVNGEPLYTTGGVLENTQLENCRTLSVYKNRVIASGFNSNVLYYSKSSQQNAPVEFTKEGYIEIENDSDPITGHAQMDDKLIVFKQRKIIIFTGDGANDLGSQSSFSQPYILPSDVGCIDHESICVIPQGMLFKSDKGIYILDRSLGVKYIGLFVKDFNDYTISKSIVIKHDNQIHQVRMNLKEINKTLVYDYLTDRWSTFTEYGGDDACIWQDQYSAIKYDGTIVVEDPSTFKDSGSTFKQLFETQWMQLKDVQDYQRIYRLGFVGSLKSPHTLNIKTWYDYDDTNYDEYNFNSSVITGSGNGDTVYQPQIHLKRQKCESIKIRVEAIPSGGTEECLNLTDMSFEAGMKRGMMKVKAEKRM